MKTYYRKDLMVTCPKCGHEQKVSDLIDGGNCDCDEDAIYPTGFNPFDGVRSYSDRISIPYNCHCENCEAYLNVVVVCSAFAVDVYDDNLNAIMSEYTEKQKDEDED